jgi:glycosyltransferase involved in cell wall biosynthesis
VKIGLIAPSPVPFQTGGAEKLFWGLQRHINRETGHSCELIKLPSREQDFWSLVDTYEAFATLDVRHFDVLISGKYPAWMTGHPNHVVYMLHRLRGLYDAYHLFRLPLEPAIKDGPAAEFLRWLDRVVQAHRHDPGVLPECFERLRKVRVAHPDDEVSRFPGPFARRVVHVLDDFALSSDRVHRFAAISKTVTERAGYFPSQVDVHVLHPPSDLEGLGGGADDYFFTVSRLDSAKRVALIIEAMRHVDADVPLLIAGDGPEEPYLRQLAADDSRVRFLGFVSDSEIARYYRDALAVPYVPYDEDYGLVTVEAMMCAKPVVTVKDAGGPNELVRDGATGSVVAPEPRAIGLALNALCKDRDRARSMGREGRRIAGAIDWDSVAIGLIPDLLPVASRGRRTRTLTVVTTFPIYPPLGGGQSRVYHLYRHLAPTWRTDIVCFTNAGDAAMDREIAPGVREIRVPKSEQHERAEQRLSAQCSWLPVTDVAMSRLHALTPAFADALRASIATADAVVVCHPYLIDPVRSLSGDLPVWYEAQDVEVDLKKETFPATPIAADLLADVARVEARSWEEASVVFACSDSDLGRLRALYGASRAALHVVPNGVVAADVEFVAPARRAALKHRLGLAGCPIALFMGSWHPPNLRAIERVIQLARACGEVFFLVLGSAGSAFANMELPSNVAMLGAVDEATKEVVLSVADVALNTVETGSGTNLKMLDYFAAGIPVLSTPFGIRGLVCRDGEHLLVSGIDAFPTALRRLLASDAAVIQAMVERARALTETDYDWSAIARRFLSEVDDETAFRRSQIERAPGAARAIDRSLPFDNCRTSGSMTIPTGPGA